MGSAETVPAGSQQKDVDDVADVPVGIADGRKHGDEDEAVRATTTETETKDAFPTLSLASAAKETSRRRPGLPKGLHNKSSRLSARSVAAERRECRMFTPIEGLQLAKEWMH